MTNLEKVLTEVTPRRDIEAWWCFINCAVSDWDGVEVLLLVATVAPQLTPEQAHSAWHQFSDECYAAVWLSHAGPFLPAFSKWLRRRAKS